MGRDQVRASVVCVPPLLHPEVGSSAYGSSPIECPILSLPRLPTSVLQECLAMKTTRSAITAGTAPTVHPCGSSFRRAPLIRTYVVPLPSIVIGRLLRNGLPSIPSPQPMHSSRRRIPTPARTMPWSPFSSVESSTCRRSMLTSSPKPGHMGCTEALTCGPLHARRRMWTNSAERSSS
jgi:hypothetical protein